MFENYNSVVFYGPLNLGALGACDGKTFGKSHLIYNKMEKLRSRWCKCWCVWTWMGGNWNLNHNNTIPALVDVSLLIFSSLCSHSSSSEVPSHVCHRGRWLAHLWPRAASHVRWHEAGRGGCGRCCPLRRCGLVKPEESNSTARNQLSGHAALPLPAQVLPTADQRVSWFCNSSLGSKNYFSIELPFGVLKTCLDF